MGFKTKFGLQRGQKTVKAKKKERRGRGREEEREIKKVWILVWISMIFDMDFTWKARILWFCIEF